jgi:hypothetical protein
MLRAIGAPATGRSLATCRFRALELRDCSTIRPHNWMK